MKLWIRINLPIGAACQKNKELCQQLSELNAHATVIPPVTVDVQREIRLRSFYGKGDEDATHWCKDAEAALHTKKMSMQMSQTSNYTIRKHVDLHVAWPASTETCFMSRDWHVIT